MGWDGMEWDGIGWDEMRLDVALPYCTALYILFPELYLS